MESKTDDTHAESDWALEALAHIADRGELSLSLTLFVKGSVISGMLIGVKQYFDLFSDDWMEGLNLPQGDPSSAAFRKSGERQKKNASENPSYVPEFVHLKDAKIISGSESTPLGSGLLWRGRISEIDGFSVAKLNPAKSVRHA